MVNVFFPYIIDLVIGFERQSYTFNEPDNSMVITEVALVKEDNRLSEQTFFVAVGISDPTLPNVSPATSESEALGGDYQIPRANNGTPTIIFEPHMERSQYTFSLYSDEIAERREGFVIFSLPDEGSTTYTTPNLLSTVFRSTTIVIEDNDSELCCIEFYSFSLTDILLLLLLEQQKKSYKYYTINVND